MNSWYAPYPYKATDERESRDNSGGYDKRVLRGGAWCYLCDSLRASDRYSGLPDYRGSYYDGDGLGFGFRCARDY